MRKNKSLQNLSELDAQIEYMQEKMKFLKEKFPDIQTKISKDGIPFHGMYSSEIVNTDYTNLEFIRKYSSLIVMPYSLVEFSYKDRTEQIKVHSNPATSRLAYINIKREPANIVNSFGNTVKTYNAYRELNFSKIAVNFKNNAFNESMMKECRLKILELIQRNPKIKINTKYLDEKLKKLMAFT